MQSFVAKVLHALEEEGHIAREEHTHYAYGLELLASSTLSILAMLVMGAFLGKGKMVALLLLFLIPLQSFAGGYHATTHMRCFAITSCVILACVFAVPFFSLAVWTVCGVLASIIIAIMAPVQNKKAPFGETFSRRMKRVVYMLLFLAAILFWATMTAQPIVARLIALSMVCTAISVICGRLFQHIE